MNTSEYLLYVVTYFWNWAPNVHCQIFIIGKTTFVISIKCRPTFDDLEVTVNVLEQLLLTRKPYSTERCQQHTGLMGGMWQLSVGDDFKGLSSDTSSHEELWRVAYIKMMKSKTFKESSGRGTHNQIQKPWNESFIQKLRYTIIK